MHKIGLKGFLSDYDIFPAQALSPVGLYLGISGLAIQQSTTMQSSG